MPEAMELLRGSMRVHEIRQRYPRTADFLQSSGFCEACEDCPIEVAARRERLKPQGILNALTWLVFCRIDLAVK